MSSGERIERYELLGELATGGMATVYLGRQRGPFGFSRTVAIKSMHPQLTSDEGFRAMFLDEATLTAKIRHPNVVATLDIVAASTKLLLVMEFVDGVALSTLARTAAARGARIPPPIASAILCDALHGLQAAHDLVDDDGSALSVIHRDVSPQNILVGVDGLARILDFGVAKATTQRYVTQANEVKGKVAYMSPQQLCGEALDRRTDVYAAGAVLWEILTGRRLFPATNEGELIKKILDGKIEPPGFVSEDPLPAALDRVVMKALARDVGERWSSAEEMAQALAAAAPPAPRGDVTALVDDLAGEQLSARAQRLRAGTTLATDVQLVADLLTAQVTETLAFTPPRRSALGKRAVTIVVALGAIGGLAGGAFLIGSRVSRPAPLASAASSPIDLAPPSIEQPAAPPPSAPALPASAPRAPERRPLVHKPGTSAPRPAPSVDCRLPYTVDANGDRHYREECIP